MYLPSNLEFDQFASSYHLKVVGADTEHFVMTNGKTTLLAPHEWNIEFPAYYTNSSPYLHLAAAKDFAVLRFNFGSVSGSDIPVTIYGPPQTALTEWESAARATLQELEKDYGAFPHASIHIYADPNMDGGMEYCGATVTQLWGLDHELAHSYFGRSIMPANGDAGWVDEALDVWHDRGYPMYDRPKWATNMGRISPYKRGTARSAYSQGADFIGYIDTLFRKAGKDGGLKKALAEIFAEQKFKTYTSEDFRGFLEAKLGSDLKALFEAYIYGKIPTPKEEVPAASSSEKSMQTP